MFLLPWQQIAGFWPHGEAITWWLIPINTEISVLHCQSHTSFSKQCRYRWEAANKERVKSLRSFKIVFWNYLLVNKLFCSKNKKIVPDQTELNFLYKSLHATYLVILLSSPDSFHNFSRNFRKKIKVSNCMDPDQDQTYCWSWSDSKLFMNVISRWQKFDDQLFPKTGYI